MTIVMLRIDCELLQRESACEVKKAVMRITARLDEHQWKCGVLLRRFMLSFNLKIL